MCDKCMNIPCGRNLCYVNEKGVMTKLKIKKIWYVRVTPRAALTDINTNSDLSCIISFTPRCFSGLTEKLHAWLFFTHISHRHFLTRSFSAYVPFRWEDDKKQNVCILFWKVFCWFVRHLKGNLNRNSGIEKNCLFIFIYLLK